MQRGMPGVDAFAGNIEEELESCARLRGEEE
jgi:hypothetical protein